MISRSRRFLGFGPGRRSARNGWRVLSASSAADFVDELDAATSNWLAYYVIEPDYITVSGSEITQADDVSGNGYDMVPEGTGPSFDAMAGPGGRGEADFSAGGRLRNNSFANVNGTRISYFIVGVHGIGDGILLSIGGNFDDDVIQNAGGDSNIQGTLTDTVVGADVANYGSNADESDHAWSHIMASGGHAAEQDGVAFGTDYTGTGVLTVGTTTRCRYGGGQFADSDGRSSFMGIMSTSATAGEKSAIETAITNFYGLTF